MGGSSTSTNQTTKTTIPAEIRNRGTKITTGAMNNYFDPAEKQQSFTPDHTNYSTYQKVGDATTGQLNEYHDQAGQNYSDAGSSYQPHFNQASTTADAAAGNTAQNAQGPNYTTANVQGFMSPYTSSVLDEGTRRLQETHDINQSKIADNAAGVGGAFGGTRHAVEQSNNTKNFNNTLKDFTSDTLSGAFKNAQDQYNTDWGQNLTTTQANNAAAGQNFGQGMTTADFQQKMGQNTQAAQLAAAKGQLDFGNVKTAQEDAEKTNAYEKGYLNQRDYPMDTYERLAAINAMQPVNRTSTTSGTQSESGGWLGPALNAGGSLLMASDERGKEDIEDIDPEEALGAFAKIKPKSYSYKDEVVRDYPDLAREGERTGFLAQDAEGVFGREMGPETEEGMKTIDIPEILGELVAAVHGLEKRTRSLRERSRG